MEQTVEKVRAELEAIAKELKLPLENPKVILEWCKNNSYTEEIATKLIDPLYSPPSKRYYAIKIDDETGRTIARKKTKDSEWEYLQI